MLSHRCSVQRQAQPTPSNKKSNQTLHASYNKTRTIDLHALYNKPQGVAGIIQSNNNNQISNNQTRAIRFACISPSTSRCLRASYNQTRINDFIQSNNHIIKNKK
ncbi:hypothetical protein AMTRI_Chr05g70190 [Amborella trichopoda]